MEQLKKKKNTLLSVMQNESAILVMSDKVGYVEICTTQ